MKKAAIQGDFNSQYSLGYLYLASGPERDPYESANWFRMAAENTGPLEEHHLRAKSAAKVILAEYDLDGKGVVKSESEAVKWLRSAAEDNYSEAQFKLGLHYFKGHGTVKNLVEAYKWMLLAAAGGDNDAQKTVPMIEAAIDSSAKTKGQRMAQEWEVAHAKRDDANETVTPPVETEDPKISSTGFLITRNGYLVTNHHVVKDCAKVRVRTASGLLNAEIIRVDVASDLALLKIAGAFDALPVVSSRTTRLGATVATVGFPNIGLQGFDPKLSKGEISSLAGIQDDVLYFQISVPIQPGNSGGPLVDSRGNVVGVVSAQLSQEAALESTGTLAQNVNYAVKSSFLLSFLEAVPEVGAEMLEANTNEQKFEAVVDNVKNATVLILGY